MEINIKDLESQIQQLKLELQKTRYLLEEATTIINQFINDNEPLGIHSAHMNGDMFGDEITEEEFKS